MRYKLLILNLLLALAFLPVAQAMSPAAAPAKHDHGAMVMDCGHVDPGHCVDFDACVSGSHASCDTGFESAQLVVKSSALPSADALVPSLTERILSHHPELLLRPPRNA